MKPLLLLLFASLLPPLGGPLYAQTLPRPELTPGVVREMPLEQMCSTHWGLDHRFVTAQMKADVCKAYGAADCPGPKWEIDHLVPREDAGADDVKNLWPQPIAEAKVKDRVENWTHEIVCIGWKDPSRLTLDLAYVQKTFETDWGKLLMLYQAMHAKPVSKPVPKRRAPQATPVVGS
jgi:hypothetical protein